MQLSNPTYNILEIKRLIESDKILEIRLKANGGNSFMLICDPLQELIYINYLIELLPKSQYTIIDLNLLLIEFISKHKDEIVVLFDQLQSSPNQIFKAPDGEDSQDLFKEIISHIKTVLTNKKVPVLVNTSSLFGSGISNINIMENEIVMKSSIPLLILYPATYDGDKLMFLGKVPGSKYRCLIVQ